MRSVGHGDPAATRVSGDPSRRWIPLLGAIALGLLWLPPAADAAILKRVHSGTTTISSGTAVTIPLELADAGKAFVVCTVNTTSTGAQSRVTCELSNNQLVIDGGSGISPAMNVAWYVAEFESGVTVQRGTVTFPMSTASMAPTVSAVDCTKSFVVMAGEQGDGSISSQYDEGVTFRGILGTLAAPCGITAGSTTTTLTIARNGTALSNIKVAWQVVTMDGATVLARNTTTIAQASVTGTGGTGTPSNPATDFIVWSRSGGSAVAGREAEYQVRAEFTTAFQITFTRLAANNVANHHVDIAYEVVRLEDGSAVQRGSTTSSGTTTTMGAAGNIAAVDRSATVPFFSASGGSTSGSASAQAGVLDETSWIAELPVASSSSASTHLRFTRVTSSSIVGTASWFIVSFYKCANSRLCSVGVTGGNAAATVSWSPIYDPQCVVSGSSPPKPTACEAVVLRDTAPITYAPANGQTYTAGNLPPNCPAAGGCTASLRVAYIGALQTFSQNAANGLLNGTQYYYRVYPKVNGATTYITDPGMTNTISQVSVTPNASLVWTYATTGGATLNAPIAGTGKVYVASNGNKMIALDSTTGLPIADPVIANGAIQSYLSWFPESGGTSEAVVAGDQKGWLTSVDAVTGARVWSLRLPDPVTTGAGAPVQAAIAVQLNAYTRAPWQCDGGAFAAQYPTAAQDLIFVAGRNSDRTKNQVWAVRGDTDGTTPTPIVWTYPATAGTPAMDRATGQPYVDYCRNRLWVSTGNNASQHSLWVLNTLDGTKITSFPGLGDQTNSSPTLSYDGTTVYVGDAAGKLYAIDAATTGATAKYSLQLPGTSPQIAGFIWEDGAASPRRLYIPVLTNGNAGIWCVEDNGSTLTACSSWSSNPRAPVAGGSPSQPLTSDTAIFYPASNGNIYQINPADGQLVGTGFTVESGIQLGGISTEDLTQLYVGTNSGRTYRINLTNGNLP